MKFISFQVAIFFLMLIHVTTNLYSQKQANNWYFGEYAGLNFNAGNPQPQSSQMISYGASAVMSDRSSGQLLFYSNGEQVWNANHEVMANGSDLRGSRYSVNTSYATPVPNTNHLYYLFTLEQAAAMPVLQGAKIYYSIIDMSLNSGYGDIVNDRKNILLHDTMTEKIAVIPHVNQVDYWLVTHEIDTNNFLVYKITHDGISGPDVYSVGAVPTLSNEEEPTLRAIGNIKASPDGKKLAVTSMATTTTEQGNPFQIFDFSDSTGSISNPITLGAYYVQLGVSFSPNSKRLYLHGFTDDGGPYTFDYLYQFSLDEADIYSSRVGLILNNPDLDRSQFEGGLANFCLELGPDGRLYGAGGRGSASNVIERNTLYVIENPNEKGFACTVTVEQFDWSNGKASIDLPNFIQTTFKDLESFTACSKETSFKVFPNPTSGKVRIEILQGCPSAYSLQIVNILGQSVRTETQMNTNSEIDLADLSKGVYLIMIQNPYHLRIVKKIIKI